MLLLLRHVLRMQAVHSPGLRDWFCFIAIGYVQLSAQVRSAGAPRSAQIVPKSSSHRELWMAPMGAKNRAAPGTSLFASAILIEIRYSVERSLQACIPGLVQARALDVVQQGGIGTHVPLGTLVSFALALVASSAG